MKMKQISDSTIKITLDIDYVLDQGMELNDFLVPNERTEEFFYAVLDELELPDNFKGSGMLSFRVTPKVDRLDIFVTKSEIDQRFNFDQLDELPDPEEIEHMDPEEFMNYMENFLAKHSQADQAAQSHLEEVEEAEEEVAGLVDSHDEGEELGRSRQDAHDEYIYYILSFSTLKQAIEYAHIIDYQTETSELFKYGESYYLTVLVDIYRERKDFPLHLLARMLEHAEEASLSRPFLREHGYLLIPEDAIEELRKVRLA